MAGKKVNGGRELENLRAELVHLQAERKLLSESLEYHERDRQLLAFEIHDGIVQDMTAALMFLEGAQGEATAAGGAAREKLDRGIALLRRTVEEARRLIHGLIPVQLDERGLVASLENLINRMQTDHSLRINFTADMQQQHLVPAVELILLRIVQEALSNVWKHSEAKEATVAVIQNDDELTLTIADQGKGFDTQQVKPTRYGLTGIRERARLIGGQASIDSQPGRGTQVTLRLKLRPELLA